MHNFLNFERDSILQQTQMRKFDDILHNPLCEIRQEIFTHTRAFTIARARG